MMKKRSKKKLNKKNLIIGAVSVTLIILFVSLFIVVSPENVVGNAFRSASKTLKNVVIGTPKLSLSCANLDCQPGYYCANGKCLKLPDAPVVATIPEIDPTLGAVYTPIFFKQFYQGEREQFGYNPKFTPNTVTFDLNNRPYIRTHAGILQILQNDGTWKKVDLVAEAMKSFDKKMDYYKQQGTEAYEAWKGQWNGWTGWWSCPYAAKADNKNCKALDCPKDCAPNDPLIKSGEQNDERVVFDSKGDAYTLLHTAAASNIKSMLLHSRDKGLTWEVYPIKNAYEGYDIRLEHQDGSNQLNNSPGILVYAQWAEKDLITKELVAKSILEYVDINKNPDGTLQLTNVPIANDFSFLSAGPSSFPNYMVTYGDLTHIVYIGGNFEPYLNHEPYSIGLNQQPDYVRTYIKTYNHKTKTLSNQVYLGNSSRSKLPATSNDGQTINWLPDDHEFPAICVDSKGILHVIIGAHGRQFQYTHSLKSNDISAWSAPVGIGEPDGPNPKYPSLGIYSGEYSYAELICDAKDNLHLIARSSGTGYHFKLVYLRKQANKEWDTFMPPTFGGPFSVPGESQYFGQYALGNGYIDDPKELGLKHKTLLYPWHVDYGNWYQKFNVDRNGRLFINYIFYIDSLFSDEAAAYRQKWPNEPLVKDDPACVKDPCWYSNTVRAHDPAIIMSDDSGDTWRLATTQDFLKGIKKN